MKQCVQDKSKSRRTLHSKLPSIAARRWTQYALGSAATALAGAGAGVTPVEAEIHQSGPVKVVVYATMSASTQEAFLPLTGGASLSFFHGLGSNRQGAGFFGLRGATTESIRGTGPASFGQASRLHRGYPVSTGTFVGGSHVDLFLGFHHDPKNPWGRHGYGYVGFRFNVGNGVQYGWARLRTLGAPENGFIVEGDAWADPGEPILVGQKQSSTEQADAVPASGSLGQLALGAAGLDSWREARGSGFNQ